MESSKWVKVQNNHNLKYRLDKHKYSNNTEIIMAKIVEDMVAIKLSKIAKDDAPAGQSIITDEIASQLEAVAQELVGEAVIVELVRG